MSAPGVTTTPPLAPFRVDSATFDDWIDLKADTLENQLPRREQPGQAALLGDLVEEAAAIGPIVGDRRVELQLIAADDPPGPGYVLIVRPRSNPDRPGLTTGWTHLTYPDPADEPRDALWLYLTNICDQANQLLTDARKVLP
ncbi:hypothetical protein ACNQVK_04445 [Mycobacterium sp. 134]|uniref:hypothetical protein n=1 Tax=Mycobacterium sp. 134 TaxID=3400425 RepID=UPI003AB01A8E